MCSGYGGLELALERLFPGRISVDAVCDNYSPARRVLAERFPGAEQYSDVYDPLIGLESADVVTFGFPCQDLSRAGKGEGLRGSRSRLFFRCAEIGHLSGARALVIENVPQALKYRRTIDEELFRYGFHARWAKASAYEAGRPHRRARVFIVATRDDGLPTPEVPAPDVAQAHLPELLPTPTVVDMGWGRTSDEWEAWRSEQRARHGNGNGHGQSLYQALGRPRPEDACVRMEDMMGLPRGWVTDLGLSVSAQRRLLGNGVVPAQGALGIHRAVMPRLSTYYPEES